MASTHRIIGVKTQHCSPSMTPLGSRPFLIIYEVYLSRMLNKFINSISYTDSSIVHIFQQCHDLDTDLVLYQIESGYNGAFTTYVVCQQGMLNLLEPWETCCYYWDKLSQTCRDFPDFSPRVSSVLSRFCFLTHEPLLEIPS